MNLKLTKTCFPDGSVKEHGNIEDVALWDMTKNYHAKQAKKKRLVKVIDWSKNKFKTA